MMFEGCRYPELGCTILLRGASTHELSRVKRATASLLFAYYNARLEVSLNPTIYCFFVVDKSKLWIYILSS